MQNYKMLDFIGKHKVALIICFLVFVAVVYASRYSFITVEVSSPGSGGKYTYQLSNQGSQVAEIKTNASKIRKLVRKATYEILATSNDSSGFTVVKTGGFFTNTNAKLVLAQEKERQYVGNNPSPCMYYVDNILYSYSCNDVYSSVVKHVPASSAQPTYTIKNTNTSVGGTIEGTLVTKTGTLILLKAPPTENTATPLHTLYRVGSNFTLTNGVPLSSLKNYQQYLIQAYLDGFIAYTDSFNEVLYFTLGQSTPKNITVGVPKDKSMKPVRLSSYGESVVALYSNNAEGQIASLDSPAKSKQASSEVFIDDKGSVKHFSFKNTYLDAKPCGTQKLCLISGKQLFVYDIVGKNPVLLYILHGVNSIQNMGNILLAVQDRGVLAFDVDKRSGYLEYSFGDYRYCGLQNSDASYTLCLIDNKNNKVALGIDQTRTNANNIDKKVFELQKLSEIKNVSAYGKYIFISPDLGELVYSSSLRSFGYNPATKKTVNAAINAEIDKIGIDRKTYTIINTAGN